MVTITNFVLVVLGLASVAVAQNYYPNQEHAAKSLLAEQYQCMAQYLGDLSQAYGMGQFWAQNQPELQQLINNRRDCARKNIITRVLCNVTQGAKVLFKMAQYVEAASTSDPHFRDQYFENIGKVCTAEVIYKANAQGSHNNMQNY